MSLVNVPLVSVVVSCYNGEAFVGECVRSVLAQNLTELELIAVDDGSTDETLSVLTSFAGDSRLRIIPLNQNFGGPSRARNVGVAAARGRFITIMDCDDLLKPDALSMVVSFLSRSPDTGLVFFNSEELDTVTGARKSAALADYDQFWRLRRETIADHMFVVGDRRRYRQLVLTNFIRTSGTTCPRHVLERIGPFDESLTNADDWDLWLRIAAQYPLGFIDRPVAVYRVRADNISQRGYRLFPDQLRVLEKHLALASDLETRRVIKRKLAERHGFLGWALRKAGDRRSARDQYRLSLKNHPTVSSLRGWCLTWLAS